MNRRDAIRLFSGAAGGLAAGRLLGEQVAAKPTRRLDPVYGTGFLTGDLFAEVVYRSMAGGQDKKKR